MTGVLQGGSAFEGLCRAQMPSLANRGMTVMFFATVTTLYSAFLSSCSSQISTTHLHRFVRTVGDISTFLRCLWDLRSMRTFLADSPCELPLSYLPEINIGDLLSLQLFLEILLAFYWMVG